MTKRILTLLKYDWLLNKRKALTILGMYLIVYICLTLFYFYIKGSVSSTPQLPFIMQNFIHSYFSVLLIITGLYVTTLLHQKFTNPQSSTTYLALPGTSTEKFIVLLADYAIAIAAVWVMYIIVFIASMTIFKLNEPSYDWGMNPFFFLTSKIPTELDIAISNQSGALADSISELISASLYMSFFTSLLSLSYYMVLNMCFRTNGQVKSIALYFGTIVLLVIICISTVLSFATKLHYDVDDLLPEQFCTFLDVIKYITYAVPLYCAVILTILHIQIRFKQAK